MDTNKDFDIKFGVGFNTNYPTRLERNKEVVKALLMTFRDVFYRIHDTYIVGIQITCNAQPAMGGGFKIKLTTGDEKDYILTGYEDSYVCMILDHVMMNIDYSFVYLACIYGDDKIVLFVGNDVKCAPNLDGHTLYYSLDRRWDQGDILYNKKNKNMYIKGGLVSEEFSWKYIQRVQTEPANIANKYIDPATMKGVDIAELYNKLMMNALDKETELALEFERLRLAQKIRNEEFNELRLDKEF